MSDDPITDLVQAILEVTAPITQMLDHMMRAPGEPDIDDVVKIMKRLLRTSSPHSRPTTTCAPRRPSSTPRCL
jgi:hypothetical protein